MRRAKAVSCIQERRKKALQKYEKREVFDRPEALNALGELIKYIEIPVDIPPMGASKGHFRF
eukprot:scaffold381_cov138-Cylindrotheca_fusiformis.AAC.2